MKIRTLFILFLTFFSLAPMIAYTIYSASSMNITAETQYELMYSDIAENESKVISEYVKKLTSTASVLLFDSDIADCSTNNQASLDNAIQQSENYVDSSLGIERIAILSSSNRLAACTDSDYTLTFTGEQLGQMTDGDVYISPILDEDGKPTGDYDLAVPCSLNSKARLLVYFYGYYTGNNVKSYFDAVIKSGSLPGSGRIIFTDSLGGTIDTKYMGILSDLTIVEYNSIKSTIFTDSSKIGQSVSFGTGKNARTSYTVKASDCGWYVSALAEGEKAYAYSSMAFNAVMGLVIGLSILFIFLHLTVNVLLTRPLLNIEHTILKIHRGDHDSRIEMGSKNEYGQIADRFNSLVDSVVMSERRHRTILEMADDIVFDWNLITKDITFSSNFNKKFSYRAPSIQFSDSFFVRGKIHPEDNERYLSDLAKLEQGIDFKDNQYRWKNAYGDYIWMSMRTSAIRDADNNIIRIVGVLSDVDREKRGELQLIRRASYDALTGVYTRESIESVISNEIEKVAEGSDSFAILFIDVDGLKAYNDQYSHITGDHVLQFVTSSIGGIVEDFGFIGRYGGDEFVVCVRNTSTNSPQNVAQDILAKLKDGFVCDTGDLLSVSVSIGVDIVGGAGRNVEQIISTANGAMQKVKKNGKSGISVAGNY